MTELRPRANRTTEIAAIVAIGIAIMLGGASLLAALSRERTFAACALALLAVMQVGALLRNRRAHPGAPNLRTTRDLLFVISACFALSFVLAPARWSIGSTIAAIEFALALELLSLLVRNESTPT